MAEWKRDKEREGVCNGEPIEADGRIDTERAQ